MILLPKTCLLAVCYYWRASNECGSNAISAVLAFIACFPCFQKILLQAGVKFFEFAAEMDVSNDNYGNFTM